MIPKDCLQLSQNRYETMCKPYKTHHLISHETIPKLLFLLSTVLLTNNAYTNIDAGKDSANYYKTFPDQ